jgi:hypothetical protein
VLTASIIRVMMEAVSTSAILINFCQTTWSNNPEDSHLCRIISLYYDYKDMVAL